MATPPVPEPADVTGLLVAWADGDRAAFEQLVPIVHRQLRRLATRAMARESKDHTLQATALVNEVYLRLVDIDDVQWTDRAHFFALAARLMRRILVDAARKKHFLKRGGGALRVDLDEALLLSVDKGDELIALDEALTRLAAFDSRRSQVVELRFFGGLEVKEIAAVLGISRHTVMRDWALARAWLLRELRRGGIQQPSKGGETHSID
jgi:RNA polymerase sigma factor (TIGR02999 family)